MGPPVRKPLMSSQLMYPLDDKRKGKIKALFSAVCKMKKNDSNFIEDEGIYDKEGTIIFRKYATLYFIMVVDDDESELAILDLISVSAPACVSPLMISKIIVDGLDRIFQNVCEVDIIFHPDKVWAELE